jgi:ADP-heptose:LPS heptosyltransferase
MSQSWLRWKFVPALARLCFPAPSATTPKAVQSVVCLRPGKLGDMIVATPLFSALKQRGGITRLAVLCSSANEPVIRHNPHIDIVRTMNFHRIFDVLNTIGWLRRQHFDALIDLTPGFSRTNFIISQFAGRGTLRVGIEKELVADRYHIHIGDCETHLADRVLDAGEALTGVSFARPRPFEIHSAPADKEAAGNSSKTAVVPVP